MDKFVEFLNAFIGLLNFLNAFIEVPAYGFYKKIVR